MAYKTDERGNYCAWAIVNGEQALFSVHPTKEQARLVFKQESHPKHFSIIKLKGKF